MRKEAVSTRRSAEGRFAWEMREVFDRFVGNEAFARRFGQTTIVGDDAFLAALRRTPFGAGVEAIPKEAAVGSQLRDREVLVCLSSADDLFLQSIRKRTSAPVHEVWRDWVLPRALYEATPSQAIRRHTAATRYSIVTPPRAASTFLCQRLEMAGLGRPTEHVRHYLVHAVQRGLVNGRDVLLWWGRLAATHQGAGLFGTKHIHPALLNLIKAVGPAERLAPALLGQRIVRIRRNLIDASVSNVIAGSSGIYHLENESGRYDYVERLARLDLSDVALVSSYAGYRFWENAVDTLLSGFGGPILEVRFETIVSNPARVVADIADFLGVDARPAPVSEQSEVWNTHTSVHREAAARLRELLRWRSPAGWAVRARRGASRVKRGLMRRVARSRQA